MTGRLWALIQGWIDTRDFPPSQAKVAERLGVSTSLVSLWKQGSTLPKPEQLRKVAETIGADYLTVLNAALTDAGYLQREELMEHDRSAPNTRAAGGREQDQDAPTRRATRATRTGRRWASSQVTRNESVKDSGVVPGTA